MSLLINKTKIHKNVNKINLLQNKILNCLNQKQKLKLNKNLLI